jgi:peptidoglycan/LPS O-acetylase OafA/YrhL
MINNYAYAYGIEPMVRTDVMWSLAIAEQFYLIWPALEKYFKKWVLPILFVLLLINQMINFPEGREWLQVNWGIVIPNLSIMNVTFTPILLGVLIAHMLNNKTSYSFLAVITAYRVMPLIYSTLLILLMVNAPVDISGITRLLIQIAMALLLVSCVIRQDHFLELFLTFKPVQYIGSISYGMYLFHLICLAASFKVLDIYGVDKEWIAFLLGTTLTMIVAGLSFKFYEKPFLNLKKRFSVL